MTPNDVSQSLTKLSDMWATAIKEAKDRGEISDLDLHVWTVSFSPLLSQMTMPILMQRMGEKLEELLKAEEKGLN